MRLILIVYGLMMNLLLMGLQIKTVLKCKGANKNTLISNCVLLSIFVVNVGLILGML